MSRRLVASISQHPVLWVFVIALLLRVSVAVFLAGLFSGTLVLDDSTYHQMAAEKAAGETAHWDQFTHTLYWATATFTVPVTLIYEVFGPEMLAAQVFVALVGAAAAAVTTRIGLEMVDVKWALVAGAVVAFLPSQVFWSGMLMKDAVVWLTLTALALTVAVAGRAVGAKLAFLALPAAVFLSALAFLRLHTVVVAAWATMVAAWAGRPQQRIQRALGAIAIATAIPWFVGGIGPAGLTLATNAGSLEDRRFNNALGANTAIIDTSVEQGGQTAREEVGAIESRAAELEAKAELIEAKPAAGPGDAGGQGDAARQAKAERLERRAERLRERARQIAANAPPAPPAADSEDEALLDPNLLHLPRGLSVMLLEPFPIPFEGSLSLRLARLESLLWYPILALALLGLWSVWSRLRVMLFPLLAGGGILVTYALAEGNIGTAHRHRGEFVWVVALLAALGLCRFMGWINERRAPETAER